MGCYYCDQCGREHVDFTRRCENCGSTGVWYRPDAADIVDGCQAAQATWSTREERKRRRAPDDDVVEIVDCYRGAYRRYKSSWREA